MCRANLDSEVVGKVTYYDPNKCCLHKEANCCSDLTVVDGKKRGWKREEDDDQLKASESGFGSSRLHLRTLKVRSRRLQMLIRSTC